MRSERFWHYLIGVLAIALVVGYGVPAVAQETEETMDPDQEEAIQQAMERSFEEEITVTGSLIPRADLAALSPVTVMEVEDELVYTGTTRIEDLVVQLPQVFAGQNATIANGATGTATIDLRYLGTNRTLVLVNGRRLAPGDASASYAPDINVIPGPLVKRVDVLTGGASTVYGSDAMAGVVNFIMDTDFEGFRGGYQYSFYQHDNSNELAQRINEESGFDPPTGSATDGDTQNAFFAVGGKFADGKGHAMAYITYRKNEEILKGYRDYVNCSVSAGSNGPVCGGSSTSPQGRFIAYNADGSFNGDYLLHWQNDGGDGHSFRPRTGADVFNYGPFNHLLRPNEKFNVGAFAYYTINDAFEPYVEIMAMSDYTDAQIAPSGNFGVYNFINCDNPLLSEQQRTTICGPGTGYGPTDLADVLILRRNVEGAPRTNQIGHDNLRLVAGIRGDLSDTWSYDLYVLHAQNNQQDSYVNDLSIERIGNALDVVTDPDTGEPVCRSGSGDGCVPWNIFREGAVTQEAVDYISTIAVQYGKTKTQVVNLTFTADMEGYGVRLGSANEGLGLAVGAEYRYQYLENFPDEVYQTANAAGFGGATPKVRGDFDVKEAFVEVALPLIQDQPLFEDLSLELGYRYSDYSTSGGFDTYKALLNWAFSDSIRIRGGYNRAVRAANVWELFRPQGFGLGGSRDICAGSDPAASLEECQRTGVTPAQYGNILPNPADQYNTLFGGNPNLDPEVADTWTAGLVWTPQGIAGLSVTLDYYNIEITEAIGSLSFDDILQQCATTGDPALCDLINRDRFGSLWFNPSVEGGSYILTTNQNIGTLTAEGVDLTAAYMIGLGDAGFLPIQLVGTYSMENTFTNPLVSYDCVGYFGFQCGQSNPEWRHRLRATWESNFGLNLSLAWRYFGDVTNDDGSPDSDLGNPADQEFWAINGIDKIDAFNWFDLAASFLMKNGIRFTVGVNNIFDEEPPLAPTFNDFNLYETYDPWGRYIFAGIEFSL